MKSGDVNVGDAELSGRVRYDDLLTILVGLGMFDRETAREVVAQQFGLDPKAEPRPVDFPLRVGTALVEAGSAATR